jgi:L-fuconolactonase
MNDRIDAHQHFWKYSASEYPWIAAGSPLQRDWLPADLEAIQGPLGLGGSIAVQARQSVEETRWLLELADRHELIRGVVGWVDLRSEQVEEQLTRFSAHPKFVGVRHVVQDEPDDRFLLGAEFVRGLRVLTGYGLRYDLLIFPKQLPAALELVEHFPEQPFVVDHCAKPLIAKGVLEPWRDQMRRLGANRNVWCKVSGLATEASWSEWSLEGLRPYLDTVLEAFGPERLMWGSDWPVCLYASSYERWWRVLGEWTAGWKEADRAAFFGGNAARFYGLS